MTALFTGFMQIFHDADTRKKILFTICMLGLYRFLIQIPLPFVNIDVLLAGTNTAADGVNSFLMLFGGNLDTFSLVAIGLAPFINASIIVQLLTVVIPHFTELQEQGEQGSKQLQMYMRYMTFPLAFLQSIGMTFYVNSQLGGNLIAMNRSTILLAAFVMSVGTMMIMFIADLITEKGISNGSSLIIFAGVVTGITAQGFGSTLALATLSDQLTNIILMFVIIVVLILLTVFILKSIKNIPVVYARQGKLQESSSLPIPLNPVGMVPIIFAMAFTTFPYIIATMVLKFGQPSESMRLIRESLSTKLNMYTTTPRWGTQIIYFVLIVSFTIFYTKIVFNADKMSDVIQKKGGYIPGIRPGEETTAYISSVLSHLSIRGGLGLGLLGVYNYIIQSFPLISELFTNLGTVPVVVAGSGIIIIVGVVQQMVDKIKTDSLMKKYDTMDI